jgi:uncharacterized membrane protein YidH (DUF202 family)
MTESPKASETDVTRRTWLAAERTWLAWWRTGIAAAALSVGVGRLLPGLAGGALWPLRLLGLGYALLAIGVLLIGALRQRHGAEALRRGGFDPVSNSTVGALTTAAILLAIGTIVTIVVEF